MRQVFASIWLFDEPFDLQRSFGLQQVRVCGEVPLRLCVVCNGKFFGTQRRKISLALLIISPENTSKMPRLSLDYLVNSNLCKPRQNFVLTFHCWKWDTRTQSYYLPARSRISKFSRSCYFRTNAWLTAVLVILKSMIVKSNYFQDCRFFLNKFLDSRSLSACVVMPPLGLWEVIWCVLWV